MIDQTDRSLSPRVSPIFTKEPTQSLRSWIVATLPNKVTLFARNSSGNESPEDSDRYLSTKHLFARMCSSFDPKEITVLEARKKRRRGKLYVATVVLVPRVLSTVYDREESETQGERGWFAASANTRRTSRGTLRLEQRETDIGNAVSSVYWPALPTLR